MTAYQKFQKLHIDHSAIGMDLNISDVKYFCTPVGAEVIGRAGVEGIHYCFIEGFGEMVFAVSPAALPGEYVHPVAKSFEDLLRLLLACGGMGAIEQAYMWDKELFDQYLMDNQPNENQKSMMRVIKDAFQIIPMEEPYAYIKNLQMSFDYGRLVFPKEYNEMVPEADTVKAAVPEWKVTYEGGFYPKLGRAGEEIRVAQTFAWGDEIWHIPAVYLCAKGMVVDFCIEVEPDEVAEFIGKWHLYEENSGSYSHAEYERIQEEHPLNVDFRSKLSVNGAELCQAQGCCVYWIPKACLSKDLETETEAKGVIEYYGYDLKKAWAVHRVSYPWTEKKPRRIHSLEMRLEREMAKIPGEPFAAPEPEKKHEILNPATGKAHILTVRAYEEREMDPMHFPDNGMEWPTKYAIMTYTLFPELENFILKDFHQGDSPRRKQGNPNGPLASSVGIIGLRTKADAGEEYYHPDGTAAKLRVCCSSMYFEKPEKIEWEFIFKENRVPDVEVKLV